MGFSDTIPQGSDEPHLKEEQNEGKGGLRRKADGGVNHVGARVEMHGMTRTEAYNGLVGTVRSVLDGGRLGVEVDTLGRVICVKPENLRLYGHWPIVRFQHHTQLRLMAPVVTCVCRNRSHTATRRQVPLSLASAFTVHKCQGMTLDRVRASLSQAFGYGMVYVALSRAKSMDQLILSSFDASKVKAHPDVIAFYRSCGCRPPTDSAEDQTEIADDFSETPCFASNRKKRRRRIFSEEKSLLEMKLETGSFAQFRKRSGSKRRRTEKESDAEDPTPGSDDQYVMDRSGLL